MTAVKRAPDRLGLLVLVAAAATVVCVAAAVAAMGLWRDDADLAALDRPLGVTELVAVVAGASAIAMIVIGGRRTAAVGWAIVVTGALTICQPFGITTTRASDTEVAAARPAAPANGASHALLDWLPLLRFRVYDLEPLVSLSDNGPTTAVRVRSWLAPGLLTDATAATGDELVSDPQSPTLLAQSPDGSWIVEVDHNWDMRLGYGITSVAGLAWWAIGLGLVGVVLVRRRRRSVAETGGVDRDRRDVEEAGSGEPPQPAG